MKGMVCIKIRVVVCVFLLIMLLCGCSKSSPVFRNVSWGMDMETVQKKEKSYSKVEGEYDEINDIYTVWNVDCFEQSSTIIYAFENDSLNTIYLQPNENTYDNAYDMIIALYEKYGEPMEIKYDMDSPLPTSVFKWKVENLEISAVYFYTNSQTMSGLNVILKPYDGDEYSEKYIPSSTMCQWGIEVDPCENVVAPWSDKFCYEHHCFVFGCDSDSVWSIKSGYPVCSKHENILK